MLQIGKINSPFSVAVFSLCKKVIAENASDIHLKTGYSPYYRDSNGFLKPLVDDGRLLTEEDVVNICISLLDKSGSNRTTFASDMIPDSIKHILEQKSGEADASSAIVLPDGSQSSLRLNLYFSQSGLCLAIRALRNHIMSMDDILLPLSLRELRKHHEGLILFCGATGSGKTTAMYSMLDAINHEAPRHIITLDDPIEIVLNGDKSIISQREVGVHTDSFDLALRSALREDPDVLLVGEMRDKATIRTALQAAETGHLVFSTIHASSVSEVVDRILSYFSAEEAPQLRTVLAASFLGIVACRLLPRKGGGRISAYEVLLRTVATTAVVKNGNMMQISDYMTQGKGMQTMEQAIEGLRLSHLLEDNDYGR